jgi:hypothetical protein
LRELVIVAPTSSATASLARSWRSRKSAMGRGGRTEAGSIAANFAIDTRGGKPETAGWPRSPYAPGSYSGEADADAGRVVSNEAVIRWLKSWGTPNQLPPPKSSE